MKKKLWSALLAVCFLTMSVLECAAFAGETGDDTVSAAENDVVTAEDEYHGMGCIKDDARELEALAMTEDMFSVDMLNGLYPDKIDLTTSMFFPTIIGDQGSVNACGPFATAYYQFTYEANKLNNTASNSYQTIYSPKYVYNYLTFGKDRGTSLLDCYGVLKNFGCLTMEQFPYRNEDGTIDYIEWSTDTEAKRNALSTRVYSIRTTNISNSSTSTPILYTGSSALTRITDLLANGKVLVARTECTWKSKPGYGKDASKCVAFRCSKGSGHAVTIVGYDDNVQCDVNGNGVIENCEKGAFKVVNSWGEKFSYAGIHSNDGTFWVLYDALNGISANTVNDWESAYTDTRTTAFDDDNTFYVMYVTNREVNYVGELDVSTSDIYSLHLDGGCRPLVGGYFTGVAPYPIGTQAVMVGADKIAFSGKLVFDYNKTPTESLIDGYNWYARFHSQDSACKASYKITDNLGKTVKDFGNLPNSTEYIHKNISLQKGDVDYSGTITSSDALDILNYTVKKINFSNVQLCLGDVNNDGKVDADDSRQVLEMVVH